MFEASLGSISAGPLPGGSDDNQGLICGVELLATNDVSSPFQFDIIHAKAMKRDLPPLVALRAFEAAARCASFKNAAEELCVTPSSVSHQIQKLEDWLGVKLFRRLNRKVVLTQEGQTYFYTLSKAFDEIDTVTKLVNRRKSPATPKQRLKVSADAGFVECWLGSRLSGFQSLVPDVQLQIAFGEDVDDHIKSGADLAVHFGRGEWPEYHSRHLLTAIEFPVCSPKLLAAGPRLARPSDLRNFSLLHERETSGWANWLRAAGVTGWDASEGPIFHSTSTVFDRVLAGEGLGLGDDLVAADLLFAGALIKPLSVVRKSDYALYFLQFRPEPDGGPITLFRDWLVRELESHEKSAAILRLDEAFAAVPADRNPARKPRS
jgi:LysR family glycine cleavage system transcriptional activator